MRTGPSSASSSNGPRIWNFKESPFKRHPGRKEPSLPAVRTLPIQHGYTTSVAAAPGVQTSAGNGRPDEVLPLPESRLRGGPHGQAVAVLDSGGRVAEPARKRRRRRGGAGSGGARDLWGPPLIS